MWALSLGLVLPLASAAPPVYITFNESLAGFDEPGGASDDTIADFEAAYANGKAMGREMGFALHGCAPGPGHPAPARHCSRVPFRPMQRVARKGWADS